MNDILLQEIRDLLANWRDRIYEFFTNIALKLDLIVEDTGSIDSTVKDIKTINQNTYNDIHNNIGEIKNNTDTIDYQLGFVVTNTNSTNTKLDLIRSPLGTIKDNTTNISSKSDIIANNIGTISTNTGRIASNTENTATNTLDIYNKVITMSSDTTQMRSDNQVVIGIMNDIKDILEGHINYGGLVANIIELNISEYTIGG